MSRGRWITSDSEDLSISFLASPERKFDIKGYITFSIRGEKGGESLDLNIADRVWENKEDSIWAGSVADFIPSGKVMRHTEFELDEQKSFRGFAIHSYESYRPWLLTRRRR